MMNRLIGMVLTMLLLYVTAASAVHHHPDDAVAQEQCTACFWHAHGLMEAPTLSTNPPAPPTFTLAVCANDRSSIADFPSDQHSRAPPLGA